MTRATGSLTTVQSMMPWWFGVRAAMLPTGSAPAEAPKVAKAKYLWSQSPHGIMLERILPGTIEPDQLPEPQSEGARLTARYCVQCHYLPNPQMHTAANWDKTVERMIWRMQGRGNLGKLMAEQHMSWANVVVGAGELRAEPVLETGEIIRFLKRNARTEAQPR
jgi:hypothetical protein